MVVIRAMVVAAGEAVVSVVASVTGTVGRVGVD